MRYDQRRQPLKNDSCERMMTMKPRPPYMENPDKYNIATEVLSSAIRVLQAAGFYESEILQLFAQVAMKPERFPVWLMPLPDDPSASAGGTAPSSGA
jgi:hypothetical protein